VGSVQYRDEIVSSIFRSNAPKDVLDLGCGTGSNIKFLNSETNYLGVDISHKYVEKARKISSTSIRNFIVTDISGKGWLKPDHFDGPVTTLAMGIFHHLEDFKLKSLLEQLSGKLAVGSKLISLDPVITKSTSKAASYIARQDRGKFIRSQEELQNLFASFGWRSNFIINSGKLRIPFDTILGTITKH
jgi:cyclopropane fatty-acyl-phospholipid synthase-like methyltransferase